MTTKVLHHYNEDHTITSANVIVPYLLEYIEPKSVIDIGCGLGQWLQVFKNHGIAKIVGVDGSHVPKDLRKIDNFIEFDLRHFNKLRKILFPENAIEKEKFDLCINLEVAEHLPENIAQDFITFLTDLSNYILFSAAIPYQTGENHINEQPHKYWVELFKQKGYVCYDLFRRKFWNDDSVNWWYRQNMFLFVQQECRLKQMNICAYDENEYIHPKLFNMYVSMTKNVKQTISEIKTISKIKNFFG